MVGGARVWDEAETRDDIEEVWRVGNSLVRKQMAF